jgi:hypothetical protein
MAIAHLTFKVLWTADELDAREQRDSAWQQHGEAAHLHVPFLASGRAGLIPSHEWPAT